MVLGGVRWCLVAYISLKLASFCCQNMSGTNDNRHYVTIVV